ncbi:MAG: YceI family protein [Poseidonibacter sp.]|uniref:YceI family protein n=1 Tax=Poseidonibacter sp. TaxID=2321188 RepID=UPI00359D3A33
MNLVKLGLASILAAGVLYAGTYNVDTSHSNVGFKVKHLMISNVSGKFDKFSGSFEYDEKTKQLKSLKGIIDVNSVNTENAKRDGHLKSADFFDAGKYPEITFTLEKIKDDYAFGKLTIHGITKDVKLDYENNGSIIDPWGNTRVGLALSGKLNRSDYGLVYNQALEAGGVVIGEKVKLNIELEGILAK